MITIAIIAVACSAIVLLGGRSTVQHQPPITNWLTTTRPPATGRQLRRAYRRQRADLRNLRNHSKVNRKT